ncbi:MAG: outer membrane lipoprotein-sorting protein [Candidatus Methylomirabilia bacterium]
MIIVSARGRVVRWALGCVVVGGLLLRPGIAAGQERDPAEVMRRVQRQDTASDERVDFTMRLIDASGRIRKRTGTVYERQVAPGSLDEMRLIRFHSPPDFRRSGVLTVEHPDRDNDQWMYLPAYHTTRRVAAANRGNRYLGTDFFYEDIMRAKTEEYRYTIRGEETLQGVRCLVIEAVPVAEKLRRETAYSKTVNWVDPRRSVILRVDYYDREQAFFKRLTMSGVERLSGKYRWREMRMEDFARRHVTIVTYHGRKIGAGVPKRHFTERYLKRGR